MHKTTSVGCIISSKFHQDRQVNGQTQRGPMVLGQPPTHVRPGRTTLERHSSLVGILDRRQRSTLPSSPPNFFLAYLLTLLASLKSVARYRQLARHSQVLHFNSSPKKSVKMVSDEFPAFQAKQTTGAESFEHGLEGGILDVEISSRWNFIDESHDNHCHNSPRPPPPHGSREPIMLSCLRRRPSSLFCPKSSY